MGPFIYELIKQYGFDNVLNILTYPVIGSFIIYTILYFCFMDKKDPTKPLSGRSLMGVFFILFGIILFSVIIMFRTICLIEYQVLSDNEYIKQLLITKTEIPFEILVNSITMCSAVYIGIEGSQASLSTLNLEKGIICPVPYKKKMRMFTVTYLWVYVCLVSVMYNSTIVNTEHDFKLDNLFLGLSTSCLILFAANKTPSLLENVSINKNKENTPKEEK